MKNLFPGYFIQNEDQLKEIWEDCIFAFDTNILKNLYRYSDSTRSEFLRILELLKDRIWLPNRVAEEFLNGRLSVISEQAKSYDDTITSIEKLKENFENSRQHPFISQGLKEKAYDIFNRICDELRKSKIHHEEKLTRDEIKAKVANLFDGHVGDSYSPDVLEDILKEGEQRYNDKTPPGYKDKENIPEEASLAVRCKPFGDLIIWKQIIQKSIDDGVNIILVTDDGKEDWWLESGGKTLGPRPELVGEFIRNTNKSFYMYKPTRFLEYASSFFEENVKQNTISEMRELAKKSLDSQKINKKRKYDIASEADILIQDLHELQNQVVRYRADKTRLERDLIIIEDKKQEILSRGKQSLISQSQVLDLEQEVIGLRSKINEIESKIALLYSEISLRNSQLDWLKRLIDSDSNHSR